jgi:hypothetical protein
VFAYCCIQAQACGRETKETERGDREIARRQRETKRTRGTFYLRQN